MMAELSPWDKMYSGLMPQVVGANTVLQPGVVVQQPAIQKVPGLDEMARQNDPNTPPAPNPENPATFNNPMSFTNKTSVTSYELSPEKKALEADVRQRLNALAQAGFDEQQAGIDDYQQQISDIGSRPYQADLTPLAGLIDQWFGGNLSQVAQAVKPETPEERNKMLLSLKEKLQNMKRGLTGDQAKILQDQLDAINDERKVLQAEQRADQRMKEFVTREGRISDRYVDTDVQKLQERLGKANAPRITNIIERLDKNIPGGVFGEGSMAGVGVAKRWSPQFLFSEEGTEIRQDAYKLLTEVIKAASGLAVTDAERMAQEKIQGLATSSTAEQFRAGLRKELEDQFANIKSVEAGFTPAAIEKYRSGGGVSSEMLNKIMKKGGGGWTSDKQKRLEELRAKKAAGNLQ